MSWRHRIAGRFPSLVIARRNVSRAKARSALAAAAIVIGVVAIGAIGAGGAAFKQSQLATIEEQGANNVFVLPGTDHEDGQFDREDLLAIQETVAPAGTVATRGESADYRRRGGRESIGVTYLGDPRELYRVQAGAVPPDWRRNAVVSASFAEEHDLTVGDRITLVRASDGEDGRTYRVVAVLAETRAFGVDEVYLPVEESPDRTYDQVRVTTGSVDDAEAAAGALRERFNDRKNRLLVVELTSLVRLFRALVNGINVFLTGLGAISLLVAGVSIANTMLMATIQRREEIGVLRAVGYGKADVVRLLLVEAGLLGTAGAAVGAAIALAAAAVANAVFLGDPLAFSTEALLYVAGAFGVGILTSLLAGVYPAYRAASERPVDALRG